MGIILAYFIMHLVLINSQKIQMVCQSSSGCSTGSAFKFSFGSNEETLCQKTQCTTGTSTTLDVRKCQKDSYGNVCSLKYCYETDNLSTCFFQGQCLSQSNQKMKCGQCQSTTCSNGLCMDFMGVQSCYSDNQCYFKEASMKTFNCPSDIDSFGYSCGCCSKAQNTGSDNGKLYSCLNQLKFVNREFENYLEESNIKQSNGEVKNQGNKQPNIIICAIYALIALLIVI